MNCRKCGKTAKIVDSRSTETSEASLTKRARDLFPGIEVKVRRHKCQCCKISFDTFELRQSELMKIIKKD